MHIGEIPCEREKTTGKKRWQDYQPVIKKQAQLLRLFTMVITGKIKLK